MAIVINENPASEQFNVLIIGNNPIELSSIYDKLRLLKDKKFIAEIAFDIKTVLRKKLKLKPSFILIDDNIGKAQLKEIVKKLSHSKATEHIPITILKNSNVGDSAEGVQEFILKENADGESIAKALLHSLRYKKTQELLIGAYLKNRRRIDIAFKKVR